jgi:hypothetical protein
MVSVYHTPSFRYAAARGASGSENPPVLGRPTHPENDPLLRQTFSHNTTRSDFMEGLGC